MENIIDTKEEQVSDDVISSKVINIKFSKEDQVISDRVIPYKVINIKFPKEFILNHIGNFCGFTPKMLWISNNFTLWYDNIFPKIKLLLSVNTIEDDDCYNFWIENVYVVYFIYIQLQNNNHINFSFRENEDEDNSQKIIKLQRKYVHILNNIMLQIFPTYRVRPLDQRERLLKKYGMVDMNQMNMMKQLIHEIGDLQRQVHVTIY